jgi:hypothetical protein
MITTLVYIGDANYERKSYLKIDGDMVTFDCSDGEYGPISFPLERLKQKLKLHENLVFEQVNNLEHE